MNTSCLCVILVSHRNNFFIIFCCFYFSSVLAGDLVVFFPAVFTFVFVLYRGLPHGDKVRDMILDYKVNFHLFLSV